MQAKNCDDRTWMKNAFTVRKLPSILLLTLALVASCGQAYAQGYAGPSLLSRGGNRPGQRGKAPVNFTIYGSIRGTYETGLLPLSDKPAGDLPAADTPKPVTLRDDTLASLQVEVGLYGAHNWRRSTLGVDYRGDWRKSTSSLRGYGGDNHALSAEYAWNPTRRWSLSASEVAGSTNRAFGGFTAPAFAEADRPGVPLNEFFDSRVYFSQSTLSAAYSQNSRLAYIVTGGYFAVRRENLALVSVNGYRASGQIDYRLTRSDSVAAIYDTAIYKYPRVFGDSKIAVYAGQYRRRISRNMDAKFLGGMFNADTTGTQRVTLDPEVALILGRPFGFEAFHRNTWHPRVEGELTYTLQTSRFSLGASQGVTPGNGIYLTTKQKLVRVGYSYSGIRKLTLGLSAGYSRGSSLSQAIADYTHKQGGGGLNYSLFPHVSLSMQADYRTFSSPGLKGRSGASFGVGLAFSPSTLPLSIY